MYKPNCKCKGKCKCNASWAYIIDIGRNPKTGKRQQKKKGGFKTKKAAEEAAAKLITELKSGLYFEESTITFEKFAYQWLSIYKNSGSVKESTIRVRNHEIKRLMDYFAKLSLKDITLKRYQDALNDLKDRGYATNTIDGAHRTGRMIFKKARELELIKKDPTEFAVVPKAIKTVEELEKANDIPNYLEKDQLKKFLRTAKEKGLDSDYPIFMLLAYTGMRIGELCALKWTDINFTEQTISITKTYYNPKNNVKKFSLLTPKTKSSVRVIDVDQSIIEILDKHRLFQKKVMLRHGDHYYDHHFVFTLIERHPGYPFYIKKVENRMERILKLAELPVELTPHSLRHTHTSLLAQAGVNLEQIMERLGHEDEKTTRLIYLHVTKDMKKEAAHKFSKLMQDL
nr:tyrosine-type recombinase/integrase [Pullulanibacillus camelliae]